MHSNKALFGDHRTIFCTFNHFFTFFNICLSNCILTKKIVGRPLLNGHNALILACQSADLSTVKYLLETSGNYNFDIEATGWLGRNCMHAAVHGRKNETVMYLVSKQPLLTEKTDDKGLTPFKLSCSNARYFGSTSEQYMNIARLLFSSNPRWCLIKTEHRYSALDSIDDCVLFRTVREFIKKNRTDHAYIAEECVVCLSSESDFEFVECRHQCLCFGCAKKMYTLRRGPMVPEIAPNSHVELNSSLQTSLCDSDLVVKSVCPVCAQLVSIVDPSI